MSSERCSVGFPLNLAHCAKAKPFWCHQTREPLPTCLLSLQYAFWQIQNGISYDSPLFHKSLLCGVSRLWLSCVVGYLHLLQSYSWPLECSFNNLMSWKALSRQRCIIFFSFFVIGFNASLWDVQSLVYFFFRIKTLISIYPELCPKLFCLSIYVLYQSLGTGVFILKSCHTVVKCDF